MCQEAIDSVFDKSLFDVLQEQEEKENEEYRAELRRFVAEDL